MCTKPQHPKVRELFPADDITAQWVFALMATAQDIAAAETAFRSALDEGVAFRSSYRYRQLITRIYEAERLLIAVDQHDDVSSFVADLPECREHIAFLREAYLPLDHSRVRSVFGDMRHRTVHYSPVGSSELRDALLEAGGVEMRVLVDREKGEAFFEFPEEVAARVLIGDWKKPEVREAYRDSLEFAHRIKQAFSKLVIPALGRQCERRGVDPHLLHRDLKDS